MRFDVIVIGAGHAGVEAAHAAARLGCSVGLCTLSKETVAHMPCNPAVGGTAKGHLVREIDALGGVMGRAIDATGIQFKLLNRSRGPAVWSPRAQADKKRYGAWVAAALSAEPNITFAGITRLDNDIVAKTLAQIGDPAIPSVVDLLKSANAGRRGRAVLILRNIGSPAARKALENRLPHETDPEVKKLIRDSLRP